MSIFDEARRSITKELIEHYFYSPHARWHDDEYWTLNPMRDDQKIGSFSVNSNGQYYDQATGDRGDLINYISHQQHCSKLEAAKIIINRGYPIQHQEQKKKEKSKACYPVEPSNIEKIHAKATADCSSMGFSRVAHQYHYTNGDGELLFIIVRFEKIVGRNIEKTIRPYYWTGSTWRGGNPFTDRPLYNLKAIIDNPTLPILIVEGEKCADIKVPGYILTTWANGASSIKQTDFSPLKGRAIIIWPDHDAAGAKTVIALKKILNDHTIKVVPVPHDKGEKWDIADATNDEIATMLPQAKAMNDHQAAPTNHDDDEPFIPLGYDTDFYYALKRAENEIVKITKDSVTSTKLLPLAPLEWWEQKGLTNKAGNLHQASAASYFITACQRKKRIKKMEVIGSGFFEKDGSFYANDGEKIFDQQSNSYPYHYFLPQKILIESNKQFYNLTVKEATTDDGKWLFDLFKHQNWTNSYMGAIALGWALAAPFSGILTWRPFIWLTAARGHGKSYFLENLLKPLLMPFAYLGTGDVTPAFLRNEINNNACPVLLDEMETESERSVKNIEGLLAIIRNAASDTSAVTGRATNNGGTIEYHIKASFSCASTRLPSLDAALQSRFIILSLKDPKKNSYKTTPDDIIKLGQTAHSFIKRSFNRLDKILADVAYLKIFLLEIMSDNRTADTFAPIMAFCWHAYHDESINSHYGKEWIAAFNHYCIKALDDKQSDEEKLLELILDASLKGADNSNRTVSELLLDVYSLVSQDQFNYTDETNKKLSEGWLAKYGIKLGPMAIHENDGDKPLLLAIQTSSKALEEILKPSSLAVSYSSILKRHYCCLTPPGTETRLVRMKNMAAKRCMLFDWEQIYSRYFKEEQQY